MDTQLLARIKRYVEQRSLDGDTVNVAAIAARFNVTQKALLVGLMNLEHGMEFNMGYRDEKGWQDYGSIGEYTVVVYGDFSLLKRVLANCRGKHPDSLTNERMDVLWNSI